MFTDITLAVKAAQALNARLGDAIAIAQMPRSSKLIVCRKALLAASHGAKIVRVVTTPLPA